MIGLLAAVLLSQGLSPNAPGVTGGGKVLASFPLVTSGPLITEDANTVAHVYWNGTALVDTKGNAWTQNGTVPQVTANPFTTARVGAGPFSTSNWYSLAGLAQAGDFSVCAVFNPGALGATQMIVAKDDGTARQFAFFVSTTGTVGLQVGTSSPVTTATTATVGGPNVACAAYTKVGAGTSTGAAQLNLGTVGTATNMAVVGAATSDATIGRRVFATAEGPFTGTIYEVIVWSRALSQAEMLLIQQRVFGHYDGSAPLVVARSTSGTYAPRSAEPYTLFTAAPGVARITDAGLLVEPARTNYALQSNTMSTGTAATSPWLLSLVTVATVAGAPMGGTWAEVTSTANGGVLGGPASMATASTTTIAASVWMAKATGTGAACLLTGAASQTPTCTCTRSDGGTCTATVLTGADAGFCLGCVSDLGTTPVRLSLMAVLGSAKTTSTMYLAPGAYGTATGTTRFSGAQLEVGTYPTSLIVTTTTATARNADVVTFTAPTGTTFWSYALDGVRTGATASPGTLTFVQGNTKSAKVCGKTTKLSGCR